MFAVFTWTNTAARQKKIKNKKQNMVMKTYKELLGTCIKSKKKTAYINALCTKPASKEKNVKKSKKVKNKLKVKPL